MNDETEILRAACEWWAKRAERRLMWAVLGWALLFTTWATLAICWWAVNGWRLPKY